MKRIFQQLIILPVLLCIATTALAEHRTNIVFALAGDPGSAELGCNGSALNKTPTSQAATKASPSAVTSTPFLTEALQVYFADHFNGPASERLWYNGDWSAENGVLQRVDSDTKNTRIHMRDAKYHEVLIRFDFQLQTSRDIRMLTGSHGHYNSVVHIRPDHFYIQTANDDTGPYFSYRHGECAYDFDPDRWYTMTVEIIGDQMIAHIDREHIAYASHPILTKDRTYFAFQVDDQPAAFDNIQILTVRKHRNQAANLERIKSIAGKHPVKKSPEDEYQIRKNNAHEWLYQRRPEYRALIKKVKDYDNSKKERFPAAFSSQKEVKKAALALRKKLNNEDPAYKELLRATHRAKRAIDAYLINQKPEVVDLPDSRRKAEMERLRRRHEDSDSYRKLAAASEATQMKLESAYPRAFISEDAIKQSRKDENKKLKDNPDYKKLQKDRGAAYRAQQDYLFANDKRLAELKQLLDARK
jgi:hypothetical protein